METIFISVVAYRQIGLWETFPIHSSSAMNHPSTFCRAHGVFRKKVRLDFTLGSWRKQRTGIRRPISAHPCRATN